MSPFAWLQSHLGPFSRAAALAALLCTGGLVSCGSPSEPGVQVPAALQIVAGDEQEGVVGEELPGPIMVRVLDDDGDPIQGQLVNFRVTAGGGAVFAGASLTNAQGIAQERWTLGTSTVEEHRIEARAVDPETGAAIVFANFTATALAGPPAALEKYAGDGQTGTVGQPVATPPAVLVQDQYGNPVGGATVTFSVSSGGGQATGTSSTSDAHGVAAVGSWMLGPRAGEQSMLATVATLEPVAFSVNATAASATALSIVPPVPTSVKDLEPLPRLLVQLVDAYGNVVTQVGVQISASVTGGQATLGGTTSASTNADGIAEFHALTLDGTPGENTLEFTASGLASARLLIELISAGFRAARIFSGAHHMCALTDDETLYCWGDNSFGQLGNGGTGNESIPVRATAVPMKVAELSIGANHACGRPATGGIWCWGDNRYGQLGNGTRTVAQLTPTQVISDLVVGGIAAGDRHTCAGGRSATVPAIYCWGAHSHGQLGKAEPELCPDLGVPCSPVPLVAWSSPSIQIGKLRAGANHTCGITVSDLYCWGANSFGQLGRGTTETAGVVGSGTGLKAPEHVLGRNFTCVANVHALCWGENTYGQVGNGETEHVSRPVPVEGSFRFPVFGDARGDHICALGLPDGSTINGRAYCWGWGAHGQIGTGHTNVINPLPQLVSDTLQFTQIATGLSHSCGRTTSGVVYCWGTGAAIGQGSDDAQRLTPTPVLAPRNP